MIWRIFLCNKAGYSKDKKLTRFRLSKQMSGDQDEWAGRVEPSNASSDEISEKRETSPDKSRPKGRMFYFEGESRR